MKFDIQSWFTQVTTGGGLAGLLTAITAYTTHAMTWETALPLVLGSLYLVFHPEDKKGEATVEAVTKDVVTAAPIAVADSNAIISAFKAGLTHGINMNTPASTAANPAPVTQ